MTGIGRTRRNSPAMFAVRAAESATTTVPTLFVWLSARSRWTHWNGIPVDVVLGVAAASVVLALVVSWWTTRFAYGPRGLSFEQGLVFRRTSALAWPEVVAVQVSRSAAARALGCARVTIGIGAESSRSLVLAAVPDAVATDLQDHFTAARQRAHANGHLGRLARHPEPLSRRLPRRRPRPRGPPGDPARTRWSTAWAGATT